MSVIKVSKLNFENEVIQSEKTVLVDFFASWCTPCKMIAPVIEEIANENTYVKVVKVDVDAEAELAASYGIRSIPTLVVIKDGKVVNKTTGVYPKNHIEKLLDV